VVGENNIDNHPLMGKFSYFSVVLGENIYSISVISNSTVSQFQFAPDDRTISLSATGANETLGFARIAVPNSMLQNLYGGNLSFLINGEQPVLEREWMDEAYAYWYFSYANSAFETAIDPWLIVAVAAVFLIAFVLVFWFVRRKLGDSPRLFRERPQ